jgi:molybdenum cofactor guanylyltransferase
LIDTLCRSPTASYIAGCPVIGIWPVTLGFGLEAYLERGGDRSVSAWAGTVGAVPLADFDRIENVNRPEDLARINPTTATSARSKH